MADNNFVKMLAEINVELVDIPVVLKGTKLDKTIKCCKRGNIYIPQDKILIFGMGEVQFIEQDEFTELKKQRRENQKDFAKDPLKRQRLQILERKAYNYQRSQGNLKALQKTGLRPDALGTSVKIISNLLEDAEKEVQKLDVSLRTISSFELETTLIAPDANLIVHSLWRVKESVIDLAREKFLYLETVVFKS